jgi:hypothetical protein
MEEAAAIFEPLAKAHPGAYAPFYAHVLGSLVRAYVKNERNAEALRQEELCVEVYRNLNKQTSGRFASQLKNHLDILRGLYDDLGNPEGAKNVASEISELTSSR